MIIARQQSQVHHRITRENATPWWWKRARREVQQANSRRSVSHFISQSTQEPAPSTDCCTGGKHFSKNLTPLDANGNPLGMWGVSEIILLRPLVRASFNGFLQEAQEQDANKSSSEEESSEDDEASDPNKPTLTREQRRAAAKAKKEAAIARKSKKVAKPGDLPSSDEDEEEESDSEDAPANPNHTAKSRSQASAAPRDPESKTGPNASSSGAQLSRREREALQAQQAKERYQKMHAEGKTDEARADLARLSLIRERREVEAARKKAEKEEKEEADQERAKELEKEKVKRNAAMNVGGGKPGTKKK